MISIKVLSNPSRENTLERPIAAKSNPLASIIQPKTQTTELFLTNTTVPTSKDLPLQTNMIISFKTIEEKPPRSLPMTSSTKWKNSLKPTSLTPISTSITLSSSNLMPINSFKTKSLKTSIFSSSNAKNRTSPIPNKSYTLKPPLSLNKKSKKSSPFSKTLTKNTFVNTKPNPSFPPSVYHPLRY